MSLAAAHITIFEAPVIELASRRPRRRTDELSARELEVLQALAHGDRTEDLANALYLSTHTVRSHVKSVLRKLGARTRAHAVAIGYAEGALELI